MNDIPSTPEEEEAWKQLEIKLPGIDILAIPRASREDLERLERNAKNPINSRKHAPTIRIADPLDLED